MSEDLLYESNRPLGISPLGMVLVVLSALVALILFLNPASSTYDIAIGGVVVLGIALGFSTGLARFEQEYELKKTLYLAILGAAILSIVVTAFNYVEQSFTVLDSTTILVLALPAIFEELVFRVGIFLSVARVMGTRIAIIVQALLFAVYHFARNPTPTTLIVLFIGGMVFMIIFLLSRNILSSMLAHAIVNLKPVFMSLLLSPITIGIVIVAVILLIFRRSRK